MIELPKVPLQISEKALTRYQCVAEVEKQVLGGADLANAVEAESGRAHYDLRGRPLSVSKRNLYRWVAAYRHGGVEALEPVSRVRTQTSEVLSPELIDFLHSEKGDDAKASIPELIRRARERGIVDATERVDRSTVYRAARRMGLAVGRRRWKRSEADVRRFAFPHRMMMVLCDGKHFRAGAKRTRRVALFFLDDATRMGLEVVVGTSESSELLARGLYLTVRRGGLCDMFYLDRGPGFRAHDSARLCRQCHILCVLGRARCPECHGKIEKFNQTAKAGVLRGLCDPTVDDSPQALELRLRHFLFEQYNHCPHESLGMKSPSKRWEHDARELRVPSSDQDLRARFTLEDSRRVSTDNVLAVDGVDYEVPVGYAGARIRVYRSALEQTVSILHNGKVLRLHPVDLAANALARRASGRTEQGVQDDDTTPVHSAARLAYDRAHSPVTDPEGGFLPPTGKPAEDDPEP